MIRLATWRHPCFAPPLCLTRAEADEIVCARTPEPFYAVGRWYDDFSQTTDEEVRDLLEQVHPDRKLQLQRKL